VSVAISVAVSVVPERVRWAVEAIGVGPDERMPEPGRGPGVAAACCAPRFVVAELSVFYGAGPAGSLGIAPGVAKAMAD
jgi:hypothetical protein